jgi:hypothetical protein
MVVSRGTVPLEFLRLRLRKVPDSLSKLVFPGVAVAYQPGAGDGAEASIKDVWLRNTASAARSRRQLRALAQQRGPAGDAHAVVFVRCRHFASERPEIQIETPVWPVRRVPIELAPSYPQACVEHFTYAANCS